MSTFLEMYRDASKSVKLINYTIELTGLCA
jgi:hypothetical protein